MRKNPKWLNFTLTFALVGTLLTSEMTPALAARTPAAIAPRPDAEKINRARSLAADGKTPAAEKILTELIASAAAPGDKERRALLRMALAVVDFRASSAGPADGATEAGKTDPKSDATDDVIHRLAQASEDQFNQAVADGSRISDYAHFYLGLLKRRANKPQEARAEFDRVIEAHPSRATENDARFQLAQIAINEKQWRPALVQLEILRRNLKGDERYPEILYQLASVEKKSGRKSNSCKWARELFAKYPTSPSVEGWGPHLEKNLIDGEKSGCTSGNKDLKIRVRRLWLSGEDDRASAELKLLKDETDDEGGSMLDNLTVNHLIGDGRLDEAMKMLLARYNAERNRPPYLLLLAKAAASAGDYQVAVSAYQRAYEIAPRGKSGVNSLFQAAFTSYQMQDYDGASRRFERLLKVNRASKLAREAQWYIAWIRYLRGDYQGAFESFSAFAKTTPRRLGRRRYRRGAAAPVSDTVAQDRMQYWSAMSLLKMGKTTESIPIFQSLARDPSLGYYSILSYYRLIGLPGAPVPATVETHFGLKRATDPGAKPSDEEIKAAAAAAEEARAEYENALAKSAPGADSADETDKDVTADADVAPDAAAVDGGTSDAMAVPEMSPAIPAFKDAGLAVKFERVRDLVLAGLEDGARRELREIEKRARSVDDRKLLMSELASVGNFERSSYIGEVGFGAARLAGGLKGDGRIYWEFAYPRAWEGSVIQASKSTSVPEELIWGIMRAESHYRYEAQSPVGALGLMQLMPFTGRKVADLMSVKAFEVRTLLEPEINIRYGSRYLQRLVEKFSAKIPLVAAAYNAGPHRVHAWVKNFGTLDMDEFIEHIPYVETRNYVKRVARNYQIYGLLYRANAKSMSWIIQPVGLQFNEPYPQKEIW